MNIAYALIPCVAVIALLGVLLRAERSRTDKMISSNKVEIMKRTSGGRYGKELRSRKEIDEALNS